MPTPAKRASLVRKRVIQWYATHGRSFPWRMTKDPYTILIAEMLLRRTTAIAVSRVFKDFMTRFETPDSLAKARESAITRTLISLGLQSVRTKQLRRTAAIIVKEYHSKTPTSYEELKSLPGVGTYIASAVMNFAYGYPVPLVDGNVIHFIYRVFGVEFTGPSDERAWDFMTKFGGSHKAELYWGIIDLVATLCLKRKPRCSYCPLSEVCDWSMKG